MLRGQEAALLVESSGRRLTSGIVVPQKPESKFLRFPTAMAKAATMAEGEADARADPAGGGFLRLPARTVDLLEARHVPSSCFSQPPFGNGPENTLCWTPIVTSVSC